MAQTLNYSKTKSDTGSGSVATGTIYPWSKSTPPPGFLKCDGSAVSRTLYSALFEVIATTYGSGDGSSTFNVPNLTSRTLVGANSSTSVGQTGGAVDTTGAGFAISNNLTAQNSQNLGVSLTQNLGTSVSQNLSVSTTDNLSASITSNLAASTTQNLGVSVTENLSGSSSGDITNHTLSLAQIPSHAHPGTAGTPSGRGTPGDEGSGSNGRPGIGSSGSSQAHTHNNNFSGGLSGNVTGSVTGNAAGSLTGNTSGAKSGAVSGAVAGNVTSPLSGNLATNVTGNVATNVAGDVTATNVSIYEPHLVVTYIIKT